jgi:hypothetical protein
MWAMLRMAIAHQARGSRHSASMLRWARSQELKLAVKAKEQPQGVDRRVNLNR